MKAFKIIGIILLVIFVLLTVLCTIYFLFASEGYGIQELTNIFQDGFFAGLKTFFIEIWNGFKYVFKS